MCELPLRRQQRYVRDAGLSDYDAGVLCADRALADYFDAGVLSGADPKRLCNLLTQAGQKLANERDCAVPELGIASEHMARLAIMIESGDVGSTAADRIVAVMADSGEAPDAVAERLDLLQQSDAGKLAGIVDAVIAENAAAADTVTGGGKKREKAFGFLVGQVMQKTKGSANPQVVKELLEKKLK